MSKSQSYRYRVPKTNGEKILLIITFLVIATGMGWVVYSYGNIRSPLFWIVGGVEIILAFLTFLPKQPLLRAIIFVAAGTLPIVLANEIPVLAPVRSVWTVYIFALFCISIYKMFIYRPERPETRLKTLPTEFVLPGYLPGDFKESSRSAYRKKGTEVVELVYTNGGTDYLIWIKESKGAIPDHKPYKNMQVLDKIIKGIPIHIKQEILKPTSRSVKRGEPAFVEADWSNKGINFNLRSDGLPIEEAEKVIASMI
jgi:hypothetical protein